MKNVDRAVDERRYLAPSQSHGLEVDEAEVVFRAFVRTTGPLPGRLDRIPRRIGMQTVFEPGGRGSRPAAPEDTQGSPDRDDRSARDKRWELRHRR